MWLSTERMTVAVRAVDGVIVDAPPIVRRFIGQPGVNLERWMRQQPGFRGGRIAMKKATVIMLALAIAMAFAGFSWGDSFGLNFGW